MEEEFVSVTSDGEEQLQAAPEVKSADASTEKAPAPADVPPAFDPVAPALPPVVPDSTATGEVKEQPQLPLQASKAELPSAASRLVQRASSLARAIKCARVKQVANGVVASAAPRAATVAKALPGSWTVLRGLARVIAVASLAAVLLIALGLAGSTWKMSAKTAPINSVQSWTVVWPPGVAVRSSPDASATENIVANLQFGEVVQGIELPNGWLVHTARAPVGYSRICRARDGITELGLVRLDSATGHWAPQSVGSCDNLNVDIAHAQLHQQTPGPQTHSTPVANANAHVPSTSSFQPEVLTPGDALQRVHAHLRDLREQSQRLQLAMAREHAASYALATQIQSMELLAQTHVPNAMRAVDIFEVMVPTFVSADRRGDAPHASDRAFVRELKVGDRVHAIEEFGRFLRHDKGGWTPIYVDSPNAERRSIMRRVWP